MSLLNHITDMHKRKLRTTRTQNYELKNNDKKLFQNRLAKFNEE